MATPKLPPMTLITMRLPNTLLKSLARYCRDNGKSRSTVVREWIADALADNGYYSA